jgi:uncharacterized protein (DUF2252 family)
MAENSKKTSDKALLHDNTISPRDDRRARGKVMREAITRQSHAGFKISSDRPDTIDLLEQSNKGRVPELIPIRYGRMLQSPFTFYRGAAALMAFDLSKTPTTKVAVQACGDCHLLNFGAFATPERNVVFDINDFDETLPAAWEWDVKRLAASFVLLGRDNGQKPKVCEEAAEAVVRAYRERMQEFSHMSILDIWYTRFDWQSVVEETSDPQLQKQVTDSVKKAVKRTVQDHYFPKMAQEVNGKYVIKDTPPLMYHMPGKEGAKFESQVLKAFDLYKQSLQEDKQRLLDRYKFCDVAIKVVGIGSVGTLCGVALMLAPDNEPLFLQIKEARPSVLEPYVGKSDFDNQGQRVVAGQRIIQAASDIFLGWTKFDDGRHFYIRQLRDAKVKLETDRWQGNRLSEIAHVMGAILARAHARSGDAAFIDGYLGTGDEFDKAVGDFAVSYADQTEKDHAALTAAVRSGRIKAEIVD